MSSLTNLTVCTTNLCPSLTFVLASEMSPLESTESKSVTSSLSSSLDSLFSEHSYSNLNSNCISSTDKTKFKIQKELITLFDNKFNNNLSDTMGIQRNSNICCYDGRDILDLASNIVPYSWQRQTPLLDSTKFIRKVVHHSDNELIHNKYPMKYCITCGFSQPEVSI